MEGIAYFPGCSLKDTAKDFERSALSIMESLASPLVELERWNCCGTVASLTTDDLMHQLASVRNLIRTQEADSKDLVTLCSMCFNTLKRANDFVQKDQEALDKVNAFMNQEPDYEGNVHVKHLLEVLRDTIGWDKISKKVTRPLDELIVAPYYGCTLLRPRSVGIDDSEAPKIMEELVESLGATSQPFPFNTECCGSYQLVDRRDLVVERSHRILSSAVHNTADVVVTSCPLCQYNLDEAQTELAETLDDYEPIPVIYFTQLVAIALGVDTGQLPTQLEEQLLLKSKPAEGGN